MFNVILYLINSLNGAQGITASPSNMQGVCPAGYHLPSDDEWKVLEMHLGLTKAVAYRPGFRITDEGSILAGNLKLWSNEALVNNMALVHPVLRLCQLDTDTTKAPLAI